MIHSHKGMLLSFTVAVILSGCGTTTYEKNENIIPKSEFTMKEVYDNRGVLTKEEIQQNEKKQAEIAEVQMRPLGTSQDMSIYKLNKVDTDSAFYKLPNPTLYLYFPAKFSEVGGLPIPAWMSEFKMYDKDEYAHSGEMSVEVMQ